MRRQSSMILMALVLAAASLAGCQPWYKSHGFDSPQALKSPEAQPKLVEIVRGGGEHAIDAAKILASADASVTDPILGEMISALSQQCQHHYYDPEHEFFDTRTCPALANVSIKAGARAVPELVKQNTFGAVVTLGALGTAGRQGISTVVAALGSSHAGIRIEAVDALRKINTPAPQALQALEGVASEDTNPEVSAAARRTLGTLKAMAAANPDVDYTDEIEPAQPVRRPTTGPAAEPRPEDIAIVVGIETYRGTVPPSTAARADARRFAQVAEHQLGVPARNVIVLTDGDATKSSIDAYLSDWVPKNVKPGSRVYFFFAGHGAPDPETGKGYLVPWDADLRFIARQGMELEAVVAQMRELDVEQVVMVVDACFSGSGGRSVLAEGTRPLVPVQELKPTPQSKKGTEKGFAFLAAAGASEITGTLSDGSHGLFSHFFFEGLSGKADLNGDGVVTMGEVAAYVSERVPDEARRDNREQTPRYHSSSEDVDDLGLVRLK